MNQTQTIKALRDALAGTIEVLERMDTLRFLDQEFPALDNAKRAIAMTYDASEDAPNYCSSVRRCTAKDAAGELRKHLGEPLTICYQGMKFNVYRAEDVARFLARPAPVAATPAPAPGKPPGLRAFELLMIDAQENCMLDPNEAKEIIKLGPSYFGPAAPIAIARRWSLARDGFGLERNDASGEYVAYTDAVAVLRATTHKEE